MDDLEKREAPSVTDAKLILLLGLKMATHFRGGGLDGLLMLPMSEEVTSHLPLALHAPQGINKLRLAFCLLSFGAHVPESLSRRPSLLCVEAEYSSRSCLD